jgi:hypothetical protein
MKTFTRFLVLALVLHVGIVWAVPASELVARARDAEARNDVTSAVRALEELTAAGIDSNDVLYDLGTLYTRAERYGEAVWCFERVLLRAPWHFAAQRNLRATRVRLARRDAARSGRAVIETRPSLGVQCGELAPYGVSTAIVVFAQLAAVGLLVARRRNTSELARVATAAGLALTVLMGVAGVGLIAARGARPQASVILRAGVQLRQAPRVDGIPEGGVREGERVEALARDGQFARVRTAIGAMGWVLTRDLGALE